MKTKSTLSIILAVLLIIALAAAGWFAWAYFTADDQLPPGQTPSQNQDQPDDQTPTDDPTPSTSYTSEGGVAITVDQPLSEGIIKSPLTVSGTVPGNWSFEASFAVKLLDANRQEIAVAPATLSGDWMTEAQVPFSAQLVFEAPETGSGYLVLEKSNPSDLPENADRLEIPIRFN